MDYREKIFKNYISAHIAHAQGDATLINIRKQFPVWKKYFSKFLPADKKINILDVACGDGGLVLWLQNSGYELSEGIDISSEQIKKAQDLGAKNIFESDMLSYLGAREGKYDLIFMRDIIEHIKKDEMFGVLERVVNSLKTGGQLVIQTPNAESPLSGRLRYCDFTHEVGFTQDSMHEVLLAAGLKEIKTYPTGPVVHGLKSLVRFVFWKIIMLFVRFYVLVETGQARGIFTQSMITGARK